jgi:hypothetical protein
MHMADTEQGQALQPPQVPRSWRLVRVKGKTPTIVVLSGLGTHVWMHWDDWARRTQPCLSGACHSCDEGFPRRPLSYLPVYQQGEGHGGISWLRAVLEVPLRTGMRLQDLQGRAVSLRRRSTCGLIEFATLTLRTGPPSTAGWDILPQLQSLWRIPRSQLVSTVKPDELQ